jgi:type I restriction enzyme, S subunit
MRSEAATVVGDHVALQRGTTYKSGLLGAPGPVLLGLASIERNGGFRRDRLKTYGGESPDKLLLGPGDIYVSLKDVTQSGDLLGAVARVPKDIPCGRLTQDTVKLALTDDMVSQAYLYWILRTPQYRTYCRAHSMGTTNLSLSREDFLAFVIPPITAARRKLVDLLELLADKVDSNRRLAVLLEETAATIFHAWFVDFVGVEEFEEGRTGRIPAGWKDGSLDDIGTPYRRFMRGDSDLPYIGLDLMPRASTVLTEWAIEDTPQGQAAMFDAGDILFGKLRPYFRKVGVAPITGRCSTEILVLRPRNPDFYGVLLGHVASQTFIDHCAAVSRGTRMPRAEWKDAGSFRVAIPPAATAREFSDLTRIVYAQIRGLIHEFRILREIRDALLPRLISGKIRVPDTHDPEELIGPAAERLAAATL